VVTRRGALLAAGGAALLTGCGAAKDRGDTRVQLLARQLEVQQAVVEAYAGLRGREVARLHVRARARVASLERALRAAGATPAGASMHTGAASLQAALDAETGALQAHVAAAGRTRDAALRRLLGQLIASTAASQALLERRLGRDPLATAFPGQAT
jgi:hypothetical protein